MRPRPGRTRAPSRIAVAIAAALAVVAAVSCSERPAPPQDADASGPVADGSNRDAALKAWPHERVDARCRFPREPTRIREEGGAVLVAWELPYEDVYGEPVLPANEAFLAWRAAIRADSADLRRPVSDEPTPETEEEATLWADERFNAELALGGDVGAIEPIVCLDALLFAYQNARVPQLERATEFLASVLRRETSDGPEIAVVFGAGGEMYPPKSVYGFDVVDAYRAEGWRWAYALHNHTTQRRGDRLALGTPTLSTSDVQLTRGLAEERGLRSARVTNGFFTFAVPAGELGRMRSR